MMAYIEPAMRILVDLKGAAELCREASKIVGAAKDGDLKDHVAAFAVLGDVSSEVCETIIPQLQAIVDRLSDRKAAERLGTLRAQIGDTDDEKDDGDNDEGDGGEEDDDEYDFNGGSLLLERWSRRFSECCRHLMWFIAHPEPHTSSSTQNTVIENATIGGLSIGSSVKARGSVRNKP